MPPPAEDGLTRLNDLPCAEAERALARCCASRRWVSELAAARPFGSTAQLLATADRVLDDLSEADIDEALEAHPRIGERAAGEHGRWSRREQGQVAAAADGVLAALVEGNRAYERRFGHVYLVCASGRSAEELLAVLQDRLDNDPETERREVRTELGKINRIRLTRLVEEEDAA